MAGMLPGVECARRRRFPQSGGWSDSPSTAANGSTRRPSFCLYASNYDSHLCSSSSTQRITLNQAYLDEKLGGVAREAKERLDERLRAAPRKSETKRNNSQEGSVKMARELQVEVFGGLKKSGSRRFSWTKLGWKDADQDECAICLDHFKAGETLVNLPCAHRFHSRCLLPWLESNAHCPCCRLEIVNNIT